MKPLFLMALALSLPGCGERPATTNISPATPPALPAALPTPSQSKLELPPRILTFIDQKEEQVLALAKRLNLEVGDDARSYFRLAREGDLQNARRVLQGLRDHGDAEGSPTLAPGLRPLLHPPLRDVQLALDVYAEGAGKFAEAFGEGIVKSIPPGSIYWGGDRGFPIVFSKPSTAGDPFFVLTQNGLADGSYLEFARAAFGEKFQMLTEADAQRGFQSYLDDAMRRSEHDQKFPGEPRQLRPGESVMMVDGKPQTGGQVAVMAINGLLTKVIFDRNPDREFYVEESFPLDWMYPHLTPHGLIMKINRERLPSLPPEAVAKDHEFWAQRQTGFIGGWLKADTSVREVCDFVEKVHLRQDLDGFQGDPEFVRCAYAVKVFSKLRSAQGGLYTWRVNNAKSAEERQPMIKEADFAFRQSFAFDPTSPEAVFRYINLLMQMGRVDDCLLIARTAAKLKPADGQLKNLINELERIQKTTPKQAPTAP
jgi:hypothetical protein